MLLFRIFTSNSQEPKVGDRPPFCHPERSRGTCCAPFPPTKAGCPIQAVFWLEWDTTALDYPFSHSSTCLSLVISAAVYPSLNNETGHHGGCSRPPGSAAAAEG